MVIGYNLLLHPVPSIAAEIMTEKTAENPEQLPFGLLVLLTVMMFIPEIALIFSQSFRSWMRQGLEDGDGKLNKADVKDMITFYTSVISVRVFVLFSWAILFGYAELPYHFYITPLLGGFGIAAIPTLKSFLDRSAVK